MAMVPRNWRHPRTVSLLLLGEEKRQVMRLVGDWVCEGVMRRTALGAALFIYNGDDNDGNKNMGSEARFVLGGDAYCVASAEGLFGFRSRDC